MLKKNFEQYRVKDICDDMDDDDLVEFAKLFIKEASINGASFMIECKDKEYAKYTRYLTVLQKLTKVTSKITNENLDISSWYCDLLYAFGTYTGEMCIYGFYGGNEYVCPNCVHRGRCDEQCNLHLENKNK